MDQYASTVTLLAVMALAVLLLTSACASDPEAGRRMDAMSAGQLCLELGVPEARCIH